MSKLLSPYGILEAEIDRLMVDRDCGRPEATAICRQLMKNLANEADKEAAGMVLLHNIVTPAAKAPQTVSQSADGQSLRSAWPVTVETLIALGLPQNATEDQYNLYCLAEKTPLTPAFAAVLVVEMTRGLQIGKGFTFDAAMAYLKDERSDLYKMALTAKATPPIKSAANSMPQQYAKLAADTDEGKSYQGWHYVMPPWPVSTQMLAEMGLPTNPTGEDYNLLLRVFNRMGIPEKVRGELLTQIISRRAEGRAMTLEEASDFVTKRTTVPVPSAPSMGTIEEAAAKRRAANAADASAAAAQLLAIVNTSMSTQRVDYDTAWLLAKQSRPDLVALMNARPEPQPGNGIRLANSYPAPRPRVSDRQAAADEFAALVTRKMAAHGYDYSTAWDSCRVDHRDVYARMG